MTKELITVQTVKQSLGRHPMLRLGSLAFAIMNELKREGGQTYTAIANTLKENPQSVNGMLQRMIGQGLVRRDYDQKGRRAITIYYAVRENETGNRRDEIQVEVTVFVNDYGEYSVQAKVKGQSPLALTENPQPVHVDTFPIVVPKPTEPYKTRHIFHGVHREPAKKEKPLLELTKNDYTAGS